MNAFLQEIHRLFQTIQPYVVPTPTELSALQKLDIAQQKAFFVATNDARRVYEQSSFALQQLLPTLTPEELIVGYTEGNALLQRSIGGYMATHFHQAYIPLMIQEVKNQVTHTGAMFLQVLVDHMGQAVSSLVIHCLHSDSDELREAAMVAVLELRLRSAVPVIHQMISDPNPSIGEVARQVLQHLNANPNQKR